MRRIVSRFFCGSKGQVVHFIGVALQIEQLHVVVGENLLQRPRRVERAGGIVAGKLVAPVEHEREEAALVQLGLRQWRAGFVETQLLHAVAQEVCVQRGRPDIVEEHGGAHRRCALRRVGEQRRSRGRAAS